jgi:hypothetical protein
MQHPFARSLSTRRQAAWLGSIATGELRWAITIAAGVFLLLLIPPTMGRLFGPTDRIHLGTYWYSTDYSTYLSAMREGAASPSWLVHSHFTPEAHNPAFMFPLYVGMGKLAHAFAMPIESAFPIAEWVARIVLMGSMYLFVASFACPPTRRIAFVLAIFGGGLSIIVATITAGTGGLFNLKGKATVELLPFGAFFAAPHVALGLGFTLLSFVCVLHAGRGSRWSLLAIGPTILGLSLVHPYILPVPITAFGAFAALRTAAVLARRGRAAAASGTWRESWYATLVAAAAALPLLLYNAWNFSFDPFWSVTYRGQQVIPTPPPWELVMDLGVPLLLAGFGALALRRGGPIPPASALLLTWIAVALTWMYIPLPFQHRFAFGLPIALAMLAARGWPIVIEGARSLPARLGARSTIAAVAAHRVALYVLAILAFGTSATALAVLCRSAVVNEPIWLYAIDRDTYEAGLWLAENTGPDDVVAASFETGNYLGGIIPGRALMGNLTATLRPAEKHSAMEALLQGRLEPEQARRFLREHRVSYLLVGEGERALGLLDPGPALGLPAVHRTGAATIYRVAS